MVENKRGMSECLKCGWIWFQRIEKPMICPKCHSYKWNIRDKTTKITTKN